MNRYMPKSYRCNVCFRSFGTFEQAEQHWFSVHVPCDSDGTATAAANGDLPVPKDCQARAGRHRPERPGHSSMTLTWPEGR
jgi:hypothetical protein